MSKHSNSLLTNQNVENGFSIDLKETQDAPRPQESKKDLEACCLILSIDKKLQEFLEKNRYTDIIFNRLPAAIGAFSAAVIATKQGIPGLPYPNKWGVTITGVSSGLSNFSMLIHFSISKTIKESREARALLRQLKGYKYVLGWTGWYFLWSCCITGGLGQGELTAGGNLPFWLPNEDTVKTSVFCGAFIGFILSRMGSIPRLIKRVCSKEKADDLYTEPENLFCDEWFFYKLSQLQSAVFSMASIAVVSRMYSFKWLLGFDKFFGTHFCPTVPPPASDDCSTTSVGFQVLAFFPSVLSANGFYFSQERGLFHCYRACKLYWKYQEFKNSENLDRNWSKSEKYWFYAKLTLSVLLIISIPAMLSYFSIQGLLGKGSRVALPLEVAGPYFLAVNATSMWKEIEGRIKDLVAVIDSESPLVKGKSAEKTNQSSFFHHPSRVSITGSSINNNIYHSVQNGGEERAGLRSPAGNEWWFWKKLKDVFCCCSRRNNATLTEEGGAYSRL